MYSRELKALDTGNVPEALTKLLMQLNTVQSETRRELNLIAKRLDALEARIKALEE